MPAGPILGLDELVQLRAVDRIHSPFFDIEVVCECGVVLPEHSRHAFGDRLFVLPHERCMAFKNRTRTRPRRLRPHWPGFSATGFRLLGEHLLQPLQHFAGRQSVYAPQISYQPGPVDCS